MTISKFLLFAKCWSHTMVGYKRLNNIYELATVSEEKKVAGCFVECGVWRGGCSAVMATVAKNYNSKRKTYLFDSFEGLPQPSKVDGGQALGYSEGKIGKLKPIDKCVGTLEDIQEFLFNDLNLSPENLILLPGWFQKTLRRKKSQLGPIAILRIDADWYESTKICLEEFYNLVVPGGYIVIDDYGKWPGTKLAVDEFFRKNKISRRLNYIDDSGIFWQKGNEKNI